MVVEAGKIREFDRAVEADELRVQDAQENLKAAYNAAKYAGLRKDAFKAARKLRKLSNADRKHWLETFHSTIDALDLDAQLDIEDAIEAAGAIDDTLGPDDSATISDADGNVIAEFGKGSAIRKARGRHRGLN